MILEDKVFFERIIYMEHDMKLFILPCTLMTRIALRIAIFLQMYEKKSTFVDAPD